MARDGNGHDSHGHGVRPYIVVALILGVITYIEFAIIEYEIPFLSDGATMFWLIALSVAKFVMVILYFMHLKDDDATYSGFFWSGMVIALGTFVAFTFLMTAPASLDYVRAQLAPDGRFVHGQKAEDGYDDHGLDEEVVRLIESDGHTRQLASRLDDTRPKDRRLAIEPPAAPTGGWTLAAASPAAVAADEARAEAEAAAAAPAETETPSEEGDEPAAAAEDGAPSEPAPAAQAAAWDQARGESVYNANCASCHQADGQGIPGAFPPLAGGHAPELIVPEGGRTYLIDTLLYGLQGQIRVAGQSYNGVMPAWGYLSDEDLAAVINYALHAWDNAEALPDAFAPLSPDEIAAERGKGLSGSDVLELRGQLDLP
jgi:mono/diheme cytochrome c family protein/heme/copper-type cytochrome/quinol oxidase subunit 4